jgi:hypothetical protein
MIGRGVDLRSVEPVQLQKIWTLIGKLVDTPCRIDIVAQQKLACETWRRLQEA